MASFTKIAARWGYAILVGIISGLVVEYLDYRNQQLDHISAKHLKNLDGGD